MGKFKIQIVEDNPLQLSKLVFFAEKQGYAVSSTADNTDEAFQLAKRTKPDLILIDIQLQGEKTGIDLGELVKKNLDIPIIYLTSLMEDHILEKASSTDPAAYLIKPADEASLKAAIELVRINTKVLMADIAEDIHQDNEREILNDSLFVKVGRVLKRLRFEDITYIKASQLNYSSLQSRTGQLFEVRKSLTDIEKLLPGYFCRIHRQRIINCNFIESIRSDFTALTLDSEFFNIGTTYRKDLASKVPFLG